MIEKTEVACFSGHRKLPEDCSELCASLERAMITLIDRGVVFFGNGGAVGFDALAATTVLKLKEDYPHIRLVMVLPCPPEEQSLKWNEEQKRRYFETLRQADKVRVLSPRYTNSCMFDRNRHMVDNSAYLICYLQEQHGGTFYTVNYAEQRGLNILRL
ncbi:MAG: SLOG family protein [Oscillospiraceae bacterium]|nr:SLOG family protein [Oscillospiraceae bacterium]